MEQESETARPIAGFPVRRMTTSALVEELLRVHGDGEQRSLFFVNANFVIRCEHLMPQLDDPSVILVNDGVGMDIASWLVHRRRFPDNLNGTDFIPHLLEQARAKTEPGWRVFLLGAKPGIARRAAEALEARGIAVAGALDGFEESRDPQDVVAAINRTAADVVLVAMGNPLQEQWILQYRQAVQAHLLVGVGALLDFIAGDKPRAPQFVRRMRLEWLYRLSLEPTRLLRRYTLDMGRFLVISLRRGSQSMVGASGQETTK